MISKRQVLFKNKLYKNPRVLAKALHLEIRRLDKKQRLEGKTKIERRGLVKGIRKYKTKKENNDFLVIEKRIQKNVIDIIKKTMALMEYHDGTPKIVIKSLSDVSIEIVGQLDLDKIINEESGENS